MATQIPYAITAIGVALLMYLIYGITAITPVVLIIAGLDLLTVLMYVLSDYSSKKYGIDNKTKKVLQR